MPVPVPVPVFEFVLLLLLRLLVLDFYVYSFPLLLGAGCCCCRYWPGRFVLLPLLAGFRIDFGSRIGICWHSPLSERRQPRRMLLALLACSAYHWRHWQHVSPPLALAMCRRRRCSPRWFYHKHYTISVWCALWRCSSWFGYWCYRRRSHHCCCRCSFRAVAHSTANATLLNLLALA